MGSFGNLHLGAQVEVLRKNGDIIHGKVKWKGTIPNREGFWVGVELFAPVGEHDGILNNRRYFQCSRNHGLFVRPWKVRFSNKNISLRCILQTKKTTHQRSINGLEVSHNVKIENSEKLINRNGINTDSNFACIPAFAMDEINEIVTGKTQFNYGQVKRYHLSHSVGGKLKLLKPERSVNKTQRSSSSSS